MGGGGRTWGRSPNPGSAGRGAPSVRRTSAPSLFLHPPLFFFSLPAEGEESYRNDCLKLLGLLSKKKKKKGSKGGWLRQTPSWVQHLFSLFILLKAYSKILWKKKKRCHLGTAQQRQPLNVSVLPTPGVLSSSLVLIRNSFSKDRVFRAPIANVMLRCIKKKNVCKSF